MCTLVCRVQNHRPAYIYFNFLAGRLHRSINTRRCIFQKSRTTAETVTFFLKLKSFVLSNGAGNYVHALKVSFRMSISNNLSHLESLNKLTGKKNTLFFTTLGSHLPCFPTSVSQTSPWSCTQMKALLQRNTEISVHTNKSYTNFTPSTTFSKKPNH